MKLSPLCTLVLLGSIIFISCRTQENIREVCNSYMQARIAMHDGDTVELKKYTNDTMYRLNLLNQYYVKLLEAPTIRPNLNIYARQIQVDGDCAYCVMSSEEFYVVNLCKLNGRWLVSGENHEYPGRRELVQLQEKIEKREKLNQMKPARDSVLKVLNQFHEGVINYFKNQDLKMIQNTCDASTLDVIKRLYDYSLERTGRELLKNELSSQKIVLYSVIFESNQVKCKFHNDEPEVNLVKNTESFIVTGLNGMESKNITDEILSREYLPLLQSLKIIRNERFRDSRIK